MSEETKETEKPQPITIDPTALINATIEQLSLLPYKDVGGIIMEWHRFNNLINPPKKEEPKE